MAEPLASENDDVDVDAYEPGLQLRTLTHADLQVRADGDGRTVYGVLLPFDRESVIPGTEGQQREVFRRGAFRQSINNGVSRVKVFVNHGHLRGKEPIGVATSLTEEDRQLTGAFRIADTADGNDALQKINDGVFDAFSIGFSDVPGKSVRTKNLIERREVKLYEVSVVAYPAIDGASIAGIRAAFPELTDERLERWLAFVDSLDTRTLEAALGTSVDEQSTRSDEQVIHSSTANDALPAPLPNDRSFVARQRLRREIEMFHANIGKRP
jgi:HK97 family phage prohead protease